MLLRIFIFYLSIFTYLNLYAQETEDKSSDIEAPAKFKAVKPMLFVPPIKFQRLSSTQKNDIQKTVLRFLIGKPEYQVTMGTPKAVRLVSKNDIFRVELRVEKQRNNKYRLQAQLVQQVPWVESEEEAKARKMKEKKDKRRGRKRKKVKVPPSNEVIVKIMDKIIRRVRRKNIIKRKLIRSVDYAIRRIFDPEYKWTDPKKKVGKANGDASEVSEAAGKGKIKDKKAKLDISKQNDFAARIAAMKDEADLGVDDAKNKNDKKKDKKGDDSKVKKPKDKEEKKDLANAGGKVKSRLKEPKPTPKGKASPTYTSKYLSSEFLAREIIAVDAGLIGVQNDFRLAVVEYNGIIAYDKWSHKAITYMAGAGQLISNSEYDFPLYKRVGMGIGSKFNLLNLFYSFALKYESQYFVGIPDFGRGFQVAESMIAWGTFKVNWVWELFTNFMITWEFGKSLMAVSKFGERGESLALTGDFNKIWFTMEVYKNIFVGVAYENMGLVGNGFGPITVEQKSVGLALHYFL